MDQAAMVPDNQITRLPLMAVLELRLQAMFAELIQKGFGLVVWQIVYLGGETFIDEQRFSA